MWPCEETELALYFLSFLFFYFSVFGSWIMAFLRHCAGVVDEKEKEMSNYLPVYFFFSIFSLLLF